VSATVWSDATDLDLEALEGGVTAVSGVRAAGVAAGLKASGRTDLALVDVGDACPVAVVVTTNQVRAAPCVVCIDHASDGVARAVIANAGNANACTGPDGLEDAVTMAAAAARALGCRTTDVLPLSTGVIGVPLPVDRIVDAVPALVADLESDAAAAARAAAAIMTTDTVDKQRAWRVRDEEGSCIVAGMAKGAGMIEPAMATMLAVLVTDAPLDPATLREVLPRVVGRTFNRISVDSCGSTNDTVVLLATGTAARPPSPRTVERAIEVLCAQLARAIVADGEGTGKVCALTVDGAPTEAAAVAWSRAIAASSLFRAALHGSDPNWGRILAAMGTTDVPFDPERVRVLVGDVEVCRDGRAATFDREAAAAAMAGPDVAITVEVGAGPASAVYLTADLTPEYVAENAYYTT
jgi:glutamate N-acetyltransferase / amino-acid N-acetyltransferase